MVGMLTTNKKKDKHGTQQIENSGKNSGNSGNSNSGKGNNGGPKDDLEADDEDEYELVYDHAEEWEEYGEYEDLLFLEEDKERLAEEHMFNVGGFSVGFRHKVVGAAALDLKLLGVLLVVVLCGGGYYYYKSREVKYVLLAGADDE